MCERIFSKESSHRRKGYFIKGVKKLLVILLAKSQYLAESVRRIK